MSRNELITKIEQLKEWEAILEEAQAEALRDSIKAQMLAEETEELAVGAYIVRWTSVLSNRFDSTAFKKEHAELYKSFTKQVTSKRFSAKDFPLHKEKPFSEAGKQSGKEPTQIAKSGREYYNTPTPKNQ